MNQLKIDQKQITLIHKLDQIDQLRTSSISNFQFLHYYFHYMKSIQMIESHCYILLKIYKNLDIMAQQKFLRHNLDDSRLRTLSQRATIIPDTLKSTVKQLHYQGQSLMKLLTRICNNLKQIRKYRNEVYVQHMLNRLFRSTIHLADIQELFKNAIFNEDLLINRVCLQLSVSGHIKSVSYAQNYIKWLQHFDELVQSELYQLYSSYMKDLQRNIQSQVAINVQKQEELKYQLHSKKRDMFNYVSQLVTKPKYGYASSVDSISKFETKYGEFNLINHNIRYYAKQLDCISCLTFISTQNVQRRFYSFNL
ncbi:hypothetical protein pb186bvf_017500 [Paramecium bursaria]